MPSFPASLLAAHLVLLPSATFKGGSGSLIKKNLSGPVHPPKEKPKKPSKNSEKAASVDEITVNELFERFGQEPPHDMEPCRMLYEIFRSLFLKRSAADGLIDLFHSPSLVMGLSSVSPPESEKNVPVTASKKESLTVNAIASKASLTATSTGIPSATATTLVMTYIC